MPTSGPSEPSGFPGRPGDPIDPPDGSAPHRAHSSSEGEPDVYDLYRRGKDLLEQGSAAAAAQVLARAVEAEPGAPSLRETLGRAQFDAQMYAAAQQSFAVIVEQDPADHYAHFGVGLSASRRGDFRTAANHLAIASALRPDVGHYGDALRQVRATLRAREDQ